MSMFFKSKKQVPVMKIDGEPFQIKSQNEQSFTNMYHQDETIAAITNQTLSNLSIGDTKHDFGYKNEDMQKPQFHTAYEKGIPGKYDKIYDEPNCLNSIIDAFSIDGVDYIKPKLPDMYTPINIANATYTPGIKSKHNIKTINGNLYEVNYTDVKPDNKSKSLVAKAKETLLSIETLIDAPTFYEKLELDVNEKIAIVVDSAAIGIYDILIRGTFTETRPTIYYIYGPEVVNDPAKKKAPDAKEFNSHTGVNLIPCVPIADNNLYYSYSYEQNTNKHTSFLDQYYTNYKFQLSDLKKNPKGRSVEYITNLNIIGTDPGDIHPVCNSKSKNDITYLTSFLKSFIDTLRSKILSKPQTFLFSSGLQQKRSGDWLQVLLCAAIKDKLRQFMNINDESKTNIVPLVDRVYFVTHDQIALAFALLMGIDCIFTHHNGQKHFHSAFVYKILNPEADAARKQALSTQIKTTYIDELRSKVDTLITQITSYQNDKYTYADAKMNVLNAILETEINKMSSGNYVPSNPKYNLSWFINDTRGIFEKSLIAMISKTILPDLSKQKDILQVLKNDINDLASISEPVGVIEKYNKLSEQYIKILTIYETANTIGQPIFDTKISDFKKSNIYKRAVEWTWDINISSRDIVYLESDPMKHNSDRNIFLYNLNELDDIFKQKIAFIYYNYYKFLLDKCTQTTPENLNEHFKNGDGNIPERSYIKFRAVSLSFCIEVLLSFGGSGFNFNRGTDSVTNEQLSPNTIVGVMETFLTNNPNTISRLLKDDVIIEEDTKYNNETNKITAEILPTEAQYIMKEENQLIDESVLPAIGFEKPLDTYIKMAGGSEISCGSFMTSTKQVTYPLLTFILNNSIYINRLNVAIKNHLEQNNVIENDVGRTMENTDHYAPSYIENRHLNVVPVTEPNYTLPRSEYDRTAKKGKKGKNGGGIQNLRNLFDSLPKPSETKHVFYNTNNIFQDNTICFHPLLPIYMITQSYMDTINNENIETSLDFDLIVNYFSFLKKIKEQVVNIYSDANNMNINKLEAYAIGVALKQLLFVSNNDIDGYRDCIKVLNTDDKIYSKVSSFTNILCYDICGKINHADNVLQQGPIYLKSNLFVQFARTLNVNRIFGFYVDTNHFNLQNFKRDVLEFSNELASQIIADRNGNTTNYRTSSTSSTMSAKLSSDTKLKPFDPSRIKTGKDIFTYSNDTNGIKVASSSSSSSKSSQGGRRTMKNKKNVVTRKDKKHRHHKIKTMKHKKSTCKKDI